MDTTKIEIPRILKIPQYAYYAFVAKPAMTHDIVKGIKLCGFCTPRSSYQIIQ